LIDLMSANGAASPKKRVAYLATKTRNTKHCETL
jgi:hypothetical protein